MRSGLTDAPLPLLYNQAGVLIGMSYVLLPYMVLTVYSVDARHRSRASSARPTAWAPPRWQAFRRVFLPLSLPGIAGGTLLVFILSLGFFITPALMGGPVGRDDRHADRARGGDHAQLVVRLRARGRSCWR